MPRPHPSLERDVLRTAYVAAREAAARGEVLLRVPDPIWKDLLPRYRELTGNYGVPRLAGVEIQPREIEV